MSRFYYEQDGDYPRDSPRNSHYVVDTYARPGSRESHIEIPYQPSGQAMRQAGLDLAAQYNADPPWPVWDKAAATRDNYPITREQPR